ncbi:Aste57867_21931 [Aphanomyces stellatus]|uniref:Aste57867_21931 protein n=1 Tax=Aphanomyces stellatus TaxID=120398 RepID=A0A485LKX0_9STRA|nr:hypothetical protein As57867_021862 [Aphanomyces stellatus]VFT98599.1 Aste57867_21931 [Aphanomyces stellatus]
MLAVATPVAPRASTGAFPSSMHALHEASGILALLDEQDDIIRAHALQKLHEVVDHFWAEIADAVPLIESLSEEVAFSHRELAASVASKCFFHLEEYQDALRLALGAGKYFDVNVHSQYTETIIATCIDEYIAIRTNGEAKAVDPRMQIIVEQMFDRCFAAGTFKQALGVALEARRLDKVEESIRRSPDVSATLAYTFEVCRTTVTNRDFRLEVLRVLVQIYRSLPVQEHSNICQCLQILDQDAEVATILQTLVASSLDDMLVAYQVAFDLVENENQKFLHRVSTALAASVDAAAAPNPRVDKLQQILRGEFSVDLLLDFLFRQSQSDPLVMKNIKTAVENRNSVLHNSAVCAHALMNSGTTVDSFLRENLEWLGKASNWAKFTATASIGVVHKGHVRESMNLLAPYLPQGGVSTSPYSEGGALYALGLIHANQGVTSASSTTTLEYLRTALRNSGTDETVQHGACLGIGLAAMGTHNMELYEELKNIMFTDNAVAGEGAGYAIGLVLLGAGADGEMVKELVSYAHDTKHEKIIRGAVMGLALMAYGREEHADSLIEQLIRDKDPIIRYGGIYAIGMAYVGTANNSAVKRLLHIAVSDVSDDVRRAAVTCLGFVLFRTPAQVPKLVSLLAESFNPHVRYGACIAVGIACAGTFKNEAIQLLEPMLDDAVDYVRQGALFALAMVIMQESEGRNPKVKEITEKIRKLTTDKHVTTMTKMGAIFAQGILDAGGRNVVISMQSHTGFTKMSSVVGLALWAQHWFWYPLSHFLELSFQPTAVIGLNHDLKLPTGFSLVCGTKPSHFAYPKKLEEKKEEKKELVATAVLSTTAKAKARLAKQEAKEKTKEEQAAAAATTSDEAAAPAPTPVPEEKIKEPNSFNVKNPSRVTLGQVPYLSFDLSQRYIPVVPTRRPAGIIMLKDRQPNEKEDVVAVQAPSQANAEEEADAPEPFEYEPKA